MLQFPYAGITQIRFKGCYLRLTKPPLTNVQFMKIIVYRHMCVKHKTIVLFHGIAKKVVEKGGHLGEDRATNVLYDGKEGFNLRNETELCL